MVEEHNSAKTVGFGPDIAVKPDDIKDKLGDNEDKLEEIPSLHDLFIDKLPFWSEISQNKITVRILDTTSTNRIYKVDVWDNSGTSIVKSLLAKKFGILGLTINDPDMQIQIFERLGKHGLGPKILYRSGDSLIQEYIEGSCLGRYSFSRIPTLVSVASSLAKFHRVATAVSDPSWDRTPVLFKCVETWIPHAREVVGNFNNYLDIEKLVGFFEEFRGIFNNHLKNSKSHANTIVFSHNDLYCKNIIETNSDICLIDYDYSGFNYVGFDTSQILNQVHITYDFDQKKTVEYRTQYLTYEMRTMFASVYLSEALGLSGMPSKELVDEFITSLRIHTLGLAIFWAFVGIMLVKTAKSTLILPEEYYMRFSKVFCGLYEETLAELVDLGIVNLTS